MRMVAVAVLVSALLGGCVPVVEGEDAENGIQPLTGYGNPEDLAVVTGTGWLVVSEYSHHGEKPGRLSFHRVSDQKKEVAELPGSLDGETWGEPACSTFPPQVKSFHPHGIDIVKRSGALQLLVVNHRGTEKHTEQERIDFFEIHVPGGSQEIPKLSWRGCVTMPEHTRPNDVAAMPEGRGFVVSNMGASWLLARSVLGLDTGEIWAWSVDRWNCRAVQGWCKVAGSDAPAPNGVAVSPDGRHLYFSAYMGRRIVRIGGEGSEPKKSTALAITPDNLTWSGFGHLLTAGSSVHPIRLLSCRGGLEDGFCGAPFEILAIDPDSLEPCLVKVHHGESAMGFPSVALEFGKVLYLGTASGDRIARIERRDYENCG